MIAFRIDSIKLLIIQTDSNDSTDGWRPEIYGLFMCLMTCKLNENTYILATDAIQPTNMHVAPLYRLHSHTNSLRASAHIFN